MSKYNTWNIQQLISESIEINAEIHARLKAIIDLENSFLTYNPKSSDADYKTLMLAALDMARNGSDK